MKLADIAYDDVIANDEVYSEPDAYGFTLFISTL